MKCKTVAIFLVVLIVTLILTGVVLFFSLRPSPPRFTVVYVEVFRFDVAPDANTTATDLLHATCFVQLTLLCHNRNRRSSASYDPFGVFATFGEQNITAEGVVHGFHQPGRGSNIITIALAGVDRPVTQASWYQVGADMNSGRVILTFEGHGGLTWKTGPIPSGQSLHISCTVALQYRPETQSWTMQNLAPGGICDT